MGQSAGQGTCRRDDCGTEMPPIDAPVANCRTPIGLPEKTAGSRSSSPGGVLVVNRDAQARCKVTDDCVRCLHGIGHPPLIAVFNPAAGKYVIAEDSRCMARWASSGHRNAEGDLCAESATERIGDADLCLYHYQRALDWLGKRDAE